MSERPMNRHSGLLSRVPDRRARLARRRTGAGVAFLLVAAAARCVPAPTLPPAPIVTPELKMGTILRLEDTRVLADPEAPPVEAAPGAEPVAPAPAPPRADLERLVGDPEAQVRRAAALAIGRVGLPEGVPALTGALADPEVEVRQAAAFSLGLLRDHSAFEPLMAALAADQDPRVRGRAAEALGRLGDAAAAPAIGQMVTEYVRQGVLGAIEADDETYPMDPPVEAIRLGAYALARLKAYDPLASATLGGDGLPVTRWWPLAYAYQRVGDARALTILMHLASGAGIYTKAFAARGLGESGDPAAVRILTPLLDPSTEDPRVVVAAIRALAQIGGNAPPPLVDLLLRPGLDPNVRLEVVTAMGRLGAPPAVDFVMDSIADPWPAMRAAAIRTLSRMDRESFVLVLSSLEPDPHWSVRAAVATALGELDYETAAPRLDALLADEDRRVVPAALATLVRLKAPSVETIVRRYLDDDDPVIRMTAAREIAELKPAWGAAALAGAYRAWLGDPTYGPRTTALAGLAAYGPGVAGPVLTEALADREWAVRVRAAELVRALDPSASPRHAIRPVPNAAPPGVTSYEDGSLLDPAYSPQLYVETDKGTIQIELAVRDAPITVRALTELARRGFFTGLNVHRVVPNFVVQLGDPRGDGEGGPGFTLRDEINERPYLRGTVGMALDWADTGGSQLFITHSPQPHLDGGYTVIGAVVGGMDVVDRLQQWDTIRRLRVWDGFSMSEP